jgi:hypothetical protein
MAAAISPAQHPLFQAVADATQNGVRIGTLPFEARSKRLHETRASQKHSEMLLAAHALVAVGIRDFDLVPGECPDFQLRYGTESVGLEVAELVEPESARISNAAENIRIEIRERVNADPTLQAALANSFISVSAWNCPKRSLERRIVDEYERLIRNAPSPRKVGSRIQDPAYPTMTSCGVHVYHGNMKGGFVDFTTPPTAFDPQGLVPIAVKVLKRKQKKATTYSGGRQWLVMAVTDMMGTFDASVEVLGNMLPEITPFEMVIIRGSSRVAVWTPDKHVSAST